MIHHVAVVNAPPVKIRPLNVSSSIKKNFLFTKERVEKWGKRRSGQADRRIFVF